MNRDCDLFEYSLRDKRERKLRSISSRRSEYAPSVWRGRYLFGRSGNGLLKAGPLLRLSRRKPIDTDLQGSSALYSYAGPNDGPNAATQRFGRRSPGRACVVFQSSVPSAGGSATGVGPVAIDGDFLYWLERVFAPAAFFVPNPPPYAVVRTRRPTSRCTPRSDEGNAGIRPEGADPNGDVTSFSIGRGHLLYTDRGRGVVEVTPPSSFPGSLIGS